MKVKLLGVRPVAFTDEKTGELIDGFSMYISYPDPEVYGLLADKKFISGPASDKLGISVDMLIKAINSDIDLELNPRGRLSSITVCNK